MAKYRCPMNCGYTTQDSKKMDHHKRELCHDGNARKVSKVGLMTLGKAKKKNKG